MVRSMTRGRRLGLLASGLVALSGVACSGTDGQGSSPRPAPDIVLITLDTLRADALGYEGGPADTPTLDALAEQGQRFTQSYTTAPTTLPAHASMFTGLYPAAHGIHENGRRLKADVVVLAEELHDRGYATAAFVSGYPLARRFGLERGFERYDDDFGDAVERRAGKTTDQVLEFLATDDPRPLFLWVHYYDAHDPYEPPEPFASRWLEDPYYGEIEYLDRELGRLIEVLRRDLDEPVLIVAGDHGEGLGDHGEQRHGNLLYQGVMRVPLLIAGPGIDPATVEVPASIRRVFHTVLDFAGEDASGSLVSTPEEVVVAEAMKPFLQYGWQPQVMAVDGGLKAIRSGAETEVYDLAADPGERRDLAGEQRPSPGMVEALRTYPLPSTENVAADDLSKDEQRKLAALGYVSSSAPPVLRPDAPSARAMTDLFDDLDRGSALFVEERWDAAIEAFERVARRDPQNLMVQLRLAVAHSLQGREAQAEDHFQAAEEIAPESLDRKRYLALHDCRFGRWQRAEALLDPLPQLRDSIPVLQCLAEARIHRGAFSEAAELLATAVDLQPDSAAVRVRLGEARMAMGQTQAAIESFEAARELDPGGFARPLELGVLYLAAGRLREAAQALESVSPQHPGYPMALFKRAQVSVLLQEPDSAERVDLARRHADETTRALIESESLFESSEW